MRKIRQIADHLDFRMPGNGEVLVHNHAAHPINRRPERFPDKRRIVPSRPNFYAARDEFAVHLHACLGQICCPRAGAHFHTQIDQLLARALG